MNKLLFTLGLLISLSITIFPRVTYSEELKIYSETGEKETKVSFKSLKAALLDVSKHHDFFPYVTESKVLVKASEKVWVIYQKLFFPWPLNDRDSLCQWEITIKEKELLIKFYDVRRPDIAKEKEGIMRVPYSRGYWKIEELGDLRKVTYHAKGNPGGHIPHVLANLFSGNQGPKIVSALIERAEKADKKTN